ncbi:hypothetical protein HDU76_010868 [Blyttiomyces sp. JEL0837]|nr:hypothetical protein HDU76_010868 [Blyttiomyces sp. JEL0837]
MSTIANIKTSLENKSDLVTETDTITTTDNIRSLITTTLKETESRIDSKLEGFKMDLDGG